MAATQGHDGLVSLVPQPKGTEVTITCSNVPQGISAEDHAVGMASTLSNLAAFVE
jgi:hypothetical protein